MKISTNTVRNIPCALMLLLGLMLPLAGCGKKSADAQAKTVAAKQQTPAQPEAEPVHPDGIWYPQAEFQDLPHALDPFFPNSLRRQAQTAPSEQAALRHNSALVNQLAVKSILGLAPPRAWINSRSFSPGEEGEVRLPNGEKVKIRCLEIYPDRVVVEVEGVPGARELPLRLRKR